MGAASAAGEESAGAGGAAGSKGDGAGAAACSATASIASNRSKAWPAKGPPGWDRHRSRPVRQALAPAQPPAPAPPRVSVAPPPRAGDARRAGRGAARARPRPRRRQGGPRPPPPAPAPPRHCHPRADPRAAAAAAADAFRRARPRRSHRGAARPPLPRRLPHLARFQARVRVVLGRLLEARPRFPARMACHQAPGGPPHRPAGSPAAPCRGFAPAPARCATAAGPAFRRRQRRRAFRCAPRSRPAARACG